MAVGLSSKSSADELRFRRCMKFEQHGILCVRTGASLAGTLAAACDLGDIRRRYEETSRFVARTKFIVSVGYLIAKYFKTRYLS